MPLYEYTCHKCGKEQTAIRHINDRFTGPDCCGEPAEFRISMPMIAPIMGGGDFQGYKCPVTDRFVTSRRERRNIMAEHNLVEAGDKGDFKKPEPKYTDVTKPLQEVLSN